MSRIKLARPQLIGGALALAALATVAGVVFFGTRSAQAGSPSQRADVEAAAIAAAGGGQVVEVEQEGENGSVWEVEVSRPDGTVVEVALDADLRVISQGQEARD